MRVKLSKLTLFSGWNRKGICCGNIEENGPRKGQVIEKRNGRRYRGCSDC
ncbi:hypothetical protein GGR95_001812 [Sulfitobacter undariae]|uniref:Uncharacterized protein n=1 Tax=Sulfitobacter undariae TaxID=1563671 RepID=A0A7W6GZR1_9RHOB|nr:hypothetical protein [Sulfitobacter undariae]